MYVVDDWEVARELINKDEEPLGKGSFGLLYRGVYCHPEKVISYELLLSGIVLTFLSCPG